MRLGRKKPMTGKKRNVGKATADVAFRPEIISFIDYMIAVIRACA
jgi:hypothetical protein